MSEFLILEFDGVSADQYHSVNKVLGIDQGSGEGDWPAGLQSHTGATSSDGSLVVVEVWDSQESQGAFMANRLGPALGEIGVPQPKRAEWMTAIGQHHTH